MFARLDARNSFQLILLFFRLTYRSLASFNKLQVNVGGGRGANIKIADDLNVQSETGGCNIAYVLQGTVTPKSHRVAVQFMKSRMSDGHPMVSFIKIRRSERRRLDADCDKEIDDKDVDIDELEATIDHGADFGTVVDVEEN